MTLRIARVMWGTQPCWASGENQLRLYPARAKLSEVLERSILHLDGDELSIEEAHFLPPLDQSARVFCVGRNYRDHALEVAGSVPDRPSFFLRGPWSLVGHLQPLEEPSVSAQYDFEGELAVVLKKGGRHLDPDAAGACVGGVTLLMDGSVRDFQQASLFAGKNFSRSGSLGPWVVPVEAVTGEFEVETLLNGQTMQRGSIRDLIWPVQDLLAYLSCVLELQAGDIVSTGTPAGVGSARTPQVWLKQGDRIEIRSPQVGRLVNRVG